MGDGIRVSGVAFRVLVNKFTNRPPRVLALHRRSTRQRSSTQVHSSTRHDYRRPSHMRFTQLNGLTLLASAAVLLGACGGGGDNNAGATSGATSTAAATPPAGGQPA